MSDTRQTYLALGELARRWREAAPGADGTPLSGYELRVFSQNGEDGVLAEIFARIGTGGGGFVEFGVERGVQGNCVFLADVQGWPGVFLEADPDDAGALAAKYRHAPLVRVACERVTPDNVTALFAAAQVPAEPDLVSIDVDGQDLWIWRALTGHRPRVVVIEYNAGLDPAGTQVEAPDPGAAWGGTDHFGASLGALEVVARERGYRLVHAELAGVNAFFVREDLAGPFAAEVPRRGANYDLSGRSHRPDDSGRSYVELPPS